MREILSYYLSLIVLLGSVCLALYWLWQAWLRLIGVEYETDEED